MHFVFKWSSMNKLKQSKKRKEDTWEMKWKRNTIHSRAQLSFNFFSSFIISDFSGKTYEVTEGEVE